ncbi:MAG: LysM peptidoglycan-binding domain-containing protein [Nitrospinae bacterium]|nr:LysM peptidoglycan-binding domain-containing protein [Nitrospinota bacterium]
MNQVSGRLQNKGLDSFLFCFLSLPFCIMPFSLLTQKIVEEEVLKSPKVYIVKEGDNLWNITKKYLHDPFRWREVWDNNRFIINPNLIYPGDNVIIPGLFEDIESEHVSAVKAGAEVSTQEEEDETEKKPEIALSTTEEGNEEKIPQLKEITLQPPPPEKVPLTTVKILASSGYIIPKEKDKGKIFNSPESKTIFGMGDTVYINTGKKDGIKIGDKFTIYKPIRSIIHPITKNDMGLLIEILGELEIKETLNESSTADIIESYSVIELGDKLKESEGITVPMIDLAAKIESKDIDGYIIAAKDLKETVASGDIVYIDVGRDAGISEGDRFYVLGSEEGIERRGKSRGALKKPRIILGGLQVIAPKEKTSTAIIRESRKEISIGEMIEYEKKVE